MHTPIHEYIMTAGPPAPIPTISTPAKALQLFEKASISGRNRYWGLGHSNLVTMLKEKPIIPNRLNDRLSSVHISTELSKGELNWYTLLIAQIC